MILVRDIQREVAREYDLPVSVMKTPSQIGFNIRPIARPRQVAMCLSRQMTGQSLPAIGKLFGGRDHTTVIHAVRAVEKRYAADPDLRNTVDSLSVGLLLREPCL